MQIVFAGKSVVAFGTLAAFIQTVPLPVPNELAWIETVSKLGSFGILVAAVLWLVRELKETRAQARADVKEKELANQKLQEQLMDVFKSVVTAYAKNDAVVTKMQETLVDIDDKVNKWTSVRNNKGD